MTRRYAEVFAGLGLGEGDYAILVTLRRAGAPYELTPTALSRARMMTSGGMTAAPDRLEHAELVTRAPNPADRRGTLIGLTTSGRDIVERAMDAHVEAERELVGALGATDQRRLVTLLRRLLVDVDDSGPPA